MNLIQGLNTLTKLEQIKTDAESLSSKKIDTEITKIIIKNIIKKGEIGKDDIYAGLFGVGVHLLVEGVKNWFLTEIEQEKTKVINQLLLPVRTVRRRRRRTNHSNLLIR